MEAGAFENLPSKGKPIRIDNNPFEDPSSADGASSAARERIRTTLDRRSVRDRPRLCERLRTDLENARRRHAVTSPSWQRALDGFRRQVRELNARILTYNLKSPSPQFHKLPLDMEAEIRAVLERLRLAGPGEILPSGQKPVVRQTCLLHPIRPDPRPWR